MGGAGRQPALPQALAVSGLSVRYGELLALDSVTFTLGRGRICGLLGVNGSGKSTLMKAIMGQVRHASGSIAVLGEPPAAARHAGVIGYVPQAEDVDWDFPLTVADVVMMGRYGQLPPSRRPRAADRAAVAQALDRLGLAGLEGRAIGHLSGGQKKRAFVARGLAQGARVLLLDEPFAGVDKASEATISMLLRDLAASGVAILIATHDLAALPALADEAILLHRRVLVHDEPRQVLRPQNLALAFGLDPLAGAGA